jgi:hypothetical protein
LTNAHDDIDNSVFEFGIKRIHLLIRILKGRNVGRMRWESPLSGNKRRLALSMKSRPCFAASLRAFDSIKCQFIDPMKMVNTCSSHSQRSVSVVRSEVNYNCAIKQYLAKRILDSSNEVEEDHIQCKIETLPTNR